MLVDPTKPQEPCFGADMIPSYRFPLRTEPEPNEKESEPKPTPDDK
jgi:hypothetical protein